MSRMKACLFFVCFLVFTLTCESHLILKQRTIDGRTKTYYKLIGVTNDFQSTIEWCRRLGGRLPIFYNEDDFNFFADQVVVKDGSSSSIPKKTWMGLKKDRGSCSVWLDGTPISMVFKYHSTCESCTQSCCAMFMWNDRDHKQMGFQSCQTEAQGVCIVNNEEIMNPVSLTKIAEGVSEVFETLSEETGEQIETLETEITEIQSSLSRSQRSLEQHEADMTVLYANHDKDMKKGYQDLLSSTSVMIAVASVVLVMTLTLVASFCFMIYRQNKLY